MAVFKKTKRQPQANYRPSGREIRLKENPGATEQQTPAWQFHRCDEEHELWGWGKLGAQDRLKIIKKLCDFERMTWAVLKQQAGGRSQGTNSHSLSASEFVKGARSRLEELKLDDVDELFSLRLENKIRLYGIRDGRVLRFLWHDPYHGDKNGAYPTSKN